ncbi:5' nucleotidase, NT5C type [Gorillibacterium massiliense]|uniref:5' nucleotidase, NT5C type n=1 Tax=Gorillibacterium massiliense TaxID=1280390 RepID=UPI0004B51CEA|nr:5'-3'-deoxyribonucleotidase [Gorillibacterium massiliense]
MKRIAIDMDEVMADFHSKHIHLYNSKYNDSIRFEDLKGTRLWKIRSERSQEIIDLVNDPSFFRDLKVMEGSQEVIQELSRFYEIFITTAAMEHPSSFQAKFEWLSEHFPFISPMHFVFCGDKSIIKADYLIDDSSRHFGRFGGQGLLFSAPHNMYETGFIRVNNWLEVRDFFRNDERN